VTSDILNNNDTHVDEEEVPKKRYRKSRMKAAHDKEYDSDQDLCYRKGSRKLTKSLTKEMFVVDDGDENFYQSRLR